MVRHALVRIQVMLVVGLLLPSASATGNDHVATLDDAPTDAARGAAGTGVTLPLLQHKFYMRNHSTNSFTTAYVALLLQHCVFVQ